MTRIVGFLLVIGITASAVIAAPASSRADDGQIAAGIIGGLALGTLFGAAVSQPYYYAPEPAYVVPPPSCYWTRGRPAWDEYRGIWVRPRIQVCD